jgi:integrase
VIRKRGSGLQVQVYAGRDPLTGRKRWGSRQVPGQTKASHRQAKKVEAELLEQVDRGEHRGSRTRTVGELVERWFTWRQQVRPISPITVRNYRAPSTATSCRPSAAPRSATSPPPPWTPCTHRCGRTAASAACAGNASAGSSHHCALASATGHGPVRTSRSTSQTARGWPLSASAVQEVHTVLSGAFKQAVVWGWADHNPASSRPRQRSAAPAHPPPDAKGVARLLAAAMAEDRELGLFLRLAVVLGARRGELIA